MMFGRKFGEILFGQPKQTHRRPQTPAMLWMRRGFEVFLQMHERSGGLDQPLKKVIIGSVFFEPDLLQNVVCLIVTLVVPALKIRSIEGVIPYRTARRNRAVPNELAYHPRNPLAFVHEEF